MADEHFQSFYVESQGLSTLKIKYVQVTSEGQKKAPTYGAQRGVSKCSIMITFYLLQIHSKHATPGRCVQQ